MAERFWLAFLPLFVAFDALAVLPLFWGMSEGVPPQQRREAVHKAILVGALVGPAFLLVSQWVLGALGLVVWDMMIAGGLILFALALNDLLRPEKIVAGAIEEFGVVPLGVPLIVGPAVLTTLLLVRQRYGVWVTWAAFNLNMLIAWSLLLMADRLLKLMGREGARVLSKISSLVLASFAVMLVRQGLTALLVPKP